jgi:hypothetical protein
MEPKRESPCPKGPTGPVAPASFQVDPPYPPSFKEMVCHSTRLEISRHEISGKPLPKLQFASGIVILSDNYNRYIKLNK